jgi:hypothetical protein
MLTITLFSRRDDGAGVLRLSSYFDHTHAPRVLARLHAALGTSACALLATRDGDNAKRGGALLRAVAAHTGLEVRRHKLDVVGLDVLWIGPLTADESIDMETDDRFRAVGRLVMHPRASCLICSNDHGGVDAERRRFLRRATALLLADRRLGMSFASCPIPLARAMRMPAGHTTPVAVRETGQAVFVRRPARPCRAFAPDQFQVIARCNQQPALAPAAVRIAADAAGGRIELAFSPPLVFPRTRASSARDGHLRLQLCDAASGDVLLQSSALDKLRTQLAYSYMAVVVSKLLVVTLDPDEDEGLVWLAQEYPRQRLQRAEAAAARIQAAFRGWRFRRHVLWNPHTELGRAALLRAAQQAVSGV